LPHCNDQILTDEPKIRPPHLRTVSIEYPHACEGAKYNSGEGLGKCQAIHAEQNALLQCPDIMKIHTCYVTTSPCNEQCIKLLLNTPCQRIVFLEEYSKSGKEAWISAGREWIHFASSNWTALGGAVSVIQVSRSQAVFIWRSTKVRINGGYVRDVQVKSWLQRKVIKRKVYLMQ
jgi:hypothetical protein